MEKDVGEVASSIKDMGKLPIETVEKLLKNLQQSTISDFLHLVSPNIRKELNRAKIRQSASNSNSNPSPNKKEKTQQDQFVGMAESVQATFNLILESQKRPILVYF